MLSPNSFDGVLYTGEPRSTFSWDPKRLSYQSRTGALTQARLEVISDRLVSLLEEEAVISARRLIWNEMSISEFQTSVLNLIRRSHVLQASMAHGGWNQMTFSDWGWVGQRIRGQYEFFRDLINDLMSGKQALNESLVTRVRQYMRASRSTLLEMRRRLVQQLGAVSERRVLSIAEHCKSDNGLQGCVELAARGWVGIGSLPPIGSTPCRVNCRCHFIYLMIDGTEL